MKDLMMKEDKVTADLLKKAAGNYLHLHIVIQRPK